jgi:serine/threonine protein kinase
MPTHRSSADEKEGDEAVMGSVHAFPCGEHDNDSTLNDNKHGADRHNVEAVDMVTHKKDTHMNHEHGNAHIPAENRVPSTITSSTFANIPANRHAATAQFFQRYKRDCTLHVSLFGEVSRAIDLQTKRYVALKISALSLALGHTGLPKSVHSLYEGDKISLARARNGACVLEDVRKEARLLHLIAQPLGVDEIDPATWGLNVSGLHFPASAQTSTVASYEQAHLYVQRLNKGWSFIAHIHQEIEISDYHILVTDYVPGGDLFHFLMSQPRHRANESLVRRWFREACYSVRYLHAHCIAHLDLSVENMCIDESGRLRLIDFGLAVQHPHRNKNIQRASMTNDADSESKQHRIGNSHIQLWTSRSSSSCLCLTCKHNALLHRECLPQHATLKFLCKPICQNIPKPGKHGCISPELYENVPWDAYKQDIFALGVILYTMLSGFPPFTFADVSQDMWFKVIYDGSWLQPEVRLQQPASVYNSLSLISLDLVNQLIKPQHLRPSIDEVLKHPFFFVPTDASLQPATVSVATNTSTNIDTRVTNTPVRSQSY